MNKIPSSLKLHEDMISCGQWTVPLWLLSCPLMLSIWSMMSSHICSFYKKLCLRQLWVETCRWMNKKNKAHVCHWSMACNEPTGHPVISYFKREGEGQAGAIRTLRITRRRWLHYWLSLLSRSPLVPGMTAGSSKSIHKTWETWQDKWTANKDITL